MRKTFFVFLAVLGMSFTAAAAEYNLVPNPLATAKVGEWALLGNLSEQGEKVKVTVVSRGCDGNVPFVALKREHINADGKVVDTTERKVPMSRYQKRIDDLDQKASRISREKMMVKDRNITVYVIEWEDAEKDREFKIWLSYDIPVAGFVRIWSSDPAFPTYEIVDFGTE